MVYFKLRLSHLCFTFVLSSIAISCCRGQGGGGGAGGGAGGAGAGGAGGGAVVPGTQDAIQIVAQAALCFDNRPIINGCLQAMGINVNGNGNGNGNGATSTAAPPTPSSGIAGAPELAPAPAPSASMCQGPCFGQMMLMMNCANGILSNIQGYSPGLMQGVQAVYQMACGNVGNGQGGGGAGGGGAGGGGAGGAGGAAGGGASGGGGGGSGGGGGGGTNASPNAVWLTRGGKQSR
ncbi:hypothetical protein ACP70R_035205 [Stipagrostis hirtigluma subsp. patula]